MSRFLNSNRIHSQTRPKWKMNYLWCPFLCRCECRPDESDRDRWIATNRGKRSLYVQQPSFSTTNVFELRPGLSCALVEGSRIALSPHSGWVNVSIR